VNLNREETCMACPGVKVRPSVQNHGDLREHLQLDYRDDTFLLKWMRVNKPPQNDSKRRKGGGRKIEDG